MNDRAEKAAGSSDLHPVKTPSEELELLRERLDELAELADVAPLITGFREHIEEERQQNRRRLVALTVAFACVLLVLAAIPIYMSRLFVQETRAARQAQREQQQQMSQALSDSLAQMAQSSRELRAALARGGFTQAGLEPSLGESAGLPTAQAPDLSSPQARLQELETLLQQVDKAIAEREKIATPKP